MRHLTLSVVLGMAVVPALFVADVVRPPEPEELSVRSSVTVRAPADVVWENVIAFPPIDVPPEPIFAIVAMPVEARIQGTGPGARRDHLHGTTWYRLRLHPAAY